MNELRFDHGQGSWPYLIPVEIRPTRTLSKPDGIYSSGVGQHLVNARHANLPYNAQPAFVSTPLRELGTWKVRLHDQMKLPPTRLLARVVPSTRREE